MTSEENAYGWTTENGWFDGYAEVIHLFNLPSQCPYTYELKILEVTEQINLAKCSHDSYYECLAKRFVNMVLKQNIGNSQNKICSPISLPFEIYVPFCENETDISRYYQVLEDLYSDQDIHCLRSCQTGAFIF